MQLESRVKTDTAADRVSVEIRKRLGELGQSQAALARVLEESPMWVSQRLNGTVQMGVNDLARIAEAVGLKLSTLIARAEQESGRITTQYPPPRIEDLAPHIRTFPIGPLLKGEITFGDGRKGPRQLRRRPVALSA